MFDMKNLTRLKKLDEYAPKGIHKVASVDQNVSIGETLNSVVETVRVGNHNQAHSMILNQTSNVEGVVIGNHTQTCAELGCRSEPECSTGNQSFFLSSVSPNSWS